MKNIEIGHLIIAGLLILCLALLAVVVYLVYKGDQAVEHVEQIVASQTPIPVPTEAEAQADMPVVSANPHTQAIGQIEAGAGMKLSRIARLIIRDESKRFRPYGNPPHIGVGRNLRDNGISVAELQAIVNDIDYDVVLKETHIQNGRVYINSLDLANRIFNQPLTEHDIGLLLTDDLNTTRKDAVTVFGQSVWNGIDGVRKEAILDVVFNLGLTHFKTFVNFIGAVKQGNWDTAAAELLLSEAARENVIRYYRNATVLRTGDAKYFNL